MKNFFTRIKSVFVLLTFLSIGSVWASEFDTLKNVDAADYSMHARNIFQKKILDKNISQEEALASLDDLYRIAKSVKSADLEAHALAFKGHYYMYYMPDALEQAIHYYERAIAVAEQNKLNLLLCEISNRLGRETLSYGIKTGLNADMRRGLEYTLRSVKIAQSIGYDNVPHIHHYLMNVGWAYFIYQNYPKAIHYLELASEYVEPDTEVEYYLNTRLGICYERLNEYDASMTYFRKALDVVLELNDSARIGSVKGNIGHLYMLSGNLKTAYEYLSEDIRLSSKYNQWPGVGALLKMAYLEMERDDLNEVQHLIQQASEISERENISRESSFFVDYYDLLSSLHERKGDFMQALRYKDSLLMYKENMALKHNAFVITEVETSLLTEKYMTDLAILEMKNEQNRTIRNTSLVISGLTILLLVGIIHSLRMRQKRIRLKAKKQLDDYMSNLREKNLLIKKFHHEIDRLKTSHVHEGQETEEDMMSELAKSTILTEGDWHKFKTLFDKVHKGFFSNIEMLYPDLTLAEKRLLALEKIGLDTNEAAHMLGISPKSLSRTGQRLRKKLGLHNATELTKLVETI